MKVLCNWDGNTQMSDLSNLFLQTNENNTRYHLFPLTVFHCSNSIILQHIIAFVITPHCYHLYSRPVREEEARSSRSDLRAADSQC